VRKVRRKPRRKTRKAYWVVLLLLLIGVFLVAWWIWPGYYSASPRFQSMLLQKNDEVLLALNGDTLELHPQDRVKILKISTTITFNVGVRLYAGALDIPALSYEKLSLASLLPREPSEGEQRFKVHVKHFNREIGFINILVRPFVEDWLDKAERVIEPARKLDVLEEALKFAPQERRIRTRLLEEYKTQRKWKEAVALLETMAREKEDPLVLQDLVEAYEAMNQTGGILSSLKRLVQAQPDNSGIRLRYASALEKSKRIKEAVAEYEEVLKKAEKGEQAALLKTIGYLYSLIAEIPKAIQSYTKAFELDKSDSNLCYNLSSLYEKAGDQEKSDYYLGEAIRLKPEDKEGQMRLSEHLVRRGQLEEAEKQLTDLLRKSPDSMNALLLMAQVAERKKDSKKLREIYSRILSLEPENRTVMYNIGILAYEAGDLQAALPHLEKYAGAHPQEGEVRTVLFDIYRKQKKDDLAFKTAQALVALNPKDLPSHSFMLEHLVNRDEYGRIIEAAESAIRSLPNNVDLRNYLVLGYLKTGKEDLALEQMHQILRLTPKDLDLLLRIALLQEKKGLNAEALATYEKILNLAPQHEEAGEAYLRLRMGDLPHVQE
jgi:tetratricopeptide (TPR) repeat protein